MGCLPLCAPVCPPVSWLIPVELDLCRPRPHPVREAHVFKPQTHPQRQTDCNQSEISIYFSEVQSFVRVGEGRELSGAAVQIHETRTKRRQETKAVVDCNDTSLYLLRDQSVETSAKKNEEKQNQIALIKKELIEIMCD